MLKIPGIKEVCDDSKALQRIICACCEASIRGPYVTTELLLSFSLVRQKSDNALRPLVDNSTINEALTTFSNWTSFDQEVEVDGLLRVP